MAVLRHDLPPHLSADRQVHVIISVLSGTQQAQTYYDSTLVPFLAKHHVNYTTHTTTSTKSITEFTQNYFLSKARQGVQQTIILLSGDGGVIDIVNALANGLPKDLEAADLEGYVKPVVCLIPQGTANALAWSSKVASEPLDNLLTGSPKPVPIFQTTFSPGAKLVTNEGTALDDIAKVLNVSADAHIYGTVVFSWGLHASLVARSDTKEYRKHGLERFRMAAGELLEENHAYTGTIKIKPHSTNEWVILSNPKTSLTTTANATIGTGSQPQQLSYLAATLVSNLEQHYCISPEHEALSSLMHVIHISHLPQAEIGELTFLPYKGGKHVEDARVVYTAIEALRIEVDEEDSLWRQICVDGQIVQLEKNGWAEVRRLGSVSVIDVVAPIESPGGQ